MPTSEHVFSLFMDASEKDFVAAATLDGRAEYACAGSQRNTLEKMFPIIEELASRFGKKYSDFDEIYVTLGPGSNTGLRMTITSARVFFALKPHARIFGAVTHDCIFKASGLKDAITVISDRHSSFFYACYKDGKKVESGHAEHLTDIPGVASSTLVYASIDKSAHDECAALQNSKEVSIYAALTCRDAYSEYTPDNVSALVPEYSEKI